MVCGGDEQTVLRDQWTSRADARAREVTKALKTMREFAPNEAKLQGALSKMAAIAVPTLPIEVCRNDCCSVGEACDFCALPPRSRPRSVA